MPRYIGTYIPNGVRLTDIPEADLRKELHEALRDYDMRRTTGIGAPTDKVAAQAEFIAAATAVLLGLGPEYPD